MITPDLSTHEFLRKHINDVFVLMNGSPTYIMLREVNKYPHPSFITMEVQLTKNNTPYVSDTVNVSMNARTLDALSKLELLGKPKSEHFIKMANAFSLIKLELNGVS